MTQRIKHLNPNELRLCAWIHACMRSLSNKLGLDTSNIVQLKDENEFTAVPEWETHKRLEANPQHDNVSRELYVRGQYEKKSIQLERIWVTRLLLNKREAVWRLENEYYIVSGGLDLFRNDLNAKHLHTSMRHVKDRLRLDNACAGMRRKQWDQVYQKMNKTRTKHNQHELCLDTWIRLRRKRKFEEISQLISSNSPNKLEQAQEELCVKCNFLWMLIIRDLGVFWREHISVLDMERATVVGGGAKSVVEACTACHENKTLMHRLHILHSRIQPSLDATLVQYVAPYQSGWTIDMTENACCELRRWDKAKNHRHREASTMRCRSKMRCEDMKFIWRLLGYNAPLPCCGYDENR